MKKYVSMVLTLMLVLATMCVQVGALENSLDKDGEWELTDIVIPSFQQGQTCYVGSKVYCLGGTTNAVRTNAMYVYDFISNEWAQLANLPTELVGTSIVHYDGKLYAFGGYAKAPPAKTLYIYDIELNQWSTSSLPSEMVLPSACVSGNKIYVCGGTNFQTGRAAQKALYEYDPVTNMFTRKADMLTAASGATSLIEHDGALYFFGGRSGEASTPQFNLSVFDANQRYIIADDRWETFSAAPVPSAYSGIIKVDDSVYLFGHMEGAGKTMTYQPSLYQYSLTNDSWVIKDEPPITATKNIVLYEGEIYLFGGAVNRVAQPSVYKYVPSDRLYVLLGNNEVAQLSLSHNLAENKNYTWYSTNSAIASVDPDTGVVTGGTFGTCRIYAKNSDGFEDYIPVKVVENAEEHRLALHLELNTDPVKRLWLANNPSDVTWTSMDPDTATIDSVGVVTAKAKGLCIIKGELNGSEHYIYVRVNG